MKKQQLGKATEERILEAARKVYTLKGLDGARMQEIADEAGVNKALLHYYFRSKEQLFAIIFSEAIRTFIPDIVPMLRSSASFEEKVRHFVESYIELYRNNPFLPAFILREINRDPKAMKRFAESANVDMDAIRSVLVAFTEGLGLSRKEALHLLVNIISLCIFPFAAKPMIKHLMFSDDDDLMEHFLFERKETVVRFVLNSLVYGRKEKSDHGKD